MSQAFQKFIKGYIGPLKHLVNNKLANGKLFPKFFKWMEIGDRNYGGHVLPKIFRLWNSVILHFGSRLEFHRPHISKYLFSKEREIFVTGYGVILILLGIWTKKNRARPLYQTNDSYLYNYDNPTNLSARYGKFIPHYVHKYKVSAHYLEINKIFERENAQKLSEIRKNIITEFDSSTEKVKRTKYLRNPNYVYEPFGWEQDEIKN